MINPSEKYEDKDIPDNTINNLYEILKEKRVFLFLKQNQLRFHHLKL